MTELVLIRHSQADSAGENYDQLTALGYEQARLVGEWLCKSSFKFNRTVHGGLKRQEQTLAEISGVFAAAGKQLAAAESLPALAEFDLAVWGKIAASLRHGHPEFSELLKLWNKARHEDAANKGDVFKQLTGIILAEWVKQDVNFTEAESFPAFKKRVLSLLDIPTTEPIGRILAVTSGGPISLVTGEILGLDLAHTLALMRRIYNTSVHHFVRSSEKWELVSFNTVPHLPVNERTLV
jgi:broad specificity phosphatase PhoE